jgi:predicted ATP-dependent endonuclease of OLD family
MKINKLGLSNFAVFEDLNLDFSDNINIICGENATGKTTVIKALYSVVKTMEKIRIEEAKHQATNITFEHSKALIAEKLLSVFRSESIGRLVKKSVGRNSSSLNIAFDSGSKAEIQFSSLSKNKVDANKDIRDVRAENNVIFIPPKEIISSAENFSTIYENYHIAFDETYYDLLKDLEIPVKKGPNSKFQKEILKNIENTIQGRIKTENNRFYLEDKGLGKLEMGLVAEGYRKLAAILQLVNNGVLSEKSILFWDEPETNTNPKMIKSIVKTLLALSDLGVQIFISTHSYFLLKGMDIYGNDKDRDIRLFSLYRDDTNIGCETAENFNDLEHNAIVQEFHELYNMEQDQIYGD